MITILITMQIFGASVTIDSKKLYGAMSISAGKELLPIVLYEHNATGGFCWRGDILSRPPIRV